MATLIRLLDGEGEQGSLSQALKWNNEKKEFMLMGHRPMIGCHMKVGSLTARSYSDRDWWMTTEVTEILEETEEYVKFKTLNSIYEWRR